MDEVADYVRQLDYIKINLMIGNGHTNVLYIFK